MSLDNKGKHEQIIFIPQFDKLIKILTDILKVDRQIGEAAFKQLTELQKEVSEIKSQNEEILNLLYKAFAQQTDLTIFINKKQIQTMALTLDIASFVPGVLGLVDHTTGNVVAATFANELFTSSDESIFTAVQDGDDTVDITGVAEGSANLNVSADATYTDGNTGKEVTVNKSVVIPVTVTKPIEGEETDLVVNFASAGKVKSTS